ncbi:ACT domain-containing protein [Bibersteinia trehalosi]|nr:ACT domain-containing protein [Bibersteinia trehalosi]AGH37364.1 hypothetical protein WQG_780 [Bibersteinia trehalosi USDA-ARS-USMARC-192]
MSQAISNLNELLRTMTPKLNDGVYYFATLNHDDDLPLAKIIATIREEEGLSVVINEETVAEYGLQAQFKCAWISLTVHSDLAAVGLTAAFATALGNVGISCNVVAGNYHDHIFVPYEKATLAMQTLRDLQKLS